MATRFDAGGERYVRAVWNEAPSSTSTASSLSVCANQTVENPPFPRGRTNVYSDPRPSTVPGNNSGACVGEAGLGGHVLEGGFCFDE